MLGCCFGVHLYLPQERPIAALYKMAERKWQRVMKVEQGVLTSLGFPPIDYSGMVRGRTFLFKRFRLADAMSRTMSNP